MRDRSFADFFATEADRLRRTAMFLTGDPDRAMDLTQETLARVYRHWGRIKGEEPGPYARRVLVNLIRSQHRRRVLELRHAKPAMDRVESRSAEIEDWMHVAGALKGLSPIRRATVVLRFYEDMSEAEIARVLERPIGTVKSDIHRALKQLRTSLEEVREPA